MNKTKVNRVSISVSEVNKLGQLSLFFLTLKRLAKRAVLFKQYKMPAIQNERKMYSFLKKSQAAHFPSCEIKSAQRDQRDSISH